ncbi:MULTISPECIES: nuclear transport factor 2 family protein [unclassified Brevundimonas]|uniref:nuclear transport factor 2 family protein n=1 Tax=unclassified Brevundimonas TaxID=2622653 RepID=UPI0025BEFC8A|nr:MULTISPECIES: nuclear transport factor 2 family protein [unclassified Brevundimonas]
MRLGFALLDASMTLIAALIAALIQTTAPVVVIPDEATLTPIIAERDTALFTTMFDRCDPAALADLVTDDLEFYHDRGGLTATRTAFVADYAKGCEARKAPDAWRSRRELVPGTMKVYAIPGVGAVEEASHLFYERQGDGPETLVGRARFSMLWRLEDGQWRLARAFSIDHAAISPGAP